jgi:microcystin-dependent protein
MEDPFLSQVEFHGFNFAPNGYALCNGQILAISQNTALFSLLGTNFGGNGTSNFALPNLQGAVAIGYGTGAGLSPNSIGEQGGTASVTLLASEIPAHTHSFMVYAASTTNSTGTPSASTVFGTGPSSGQGPNAASVKLYANDITTSGVPVALAAGTITTVGSSTPISIMKPAVIITCAIALQGVFPARN